MEAKTPEMRLKKVNGTFTDLTLHCVGEPKSAPQWQHNGMTVSNGTLDTTIYSDTNDRNTLIMTRQNVTQHFAGRYQCVDTAFHQSDSDVLIIHAAACVTQPGIHITQQCVTLSGILVTASLVSKCLQSLINC